MPPGLGSPSSRVGSDPRHPDRALAILSLNTSFVNYTDSQGGTPTLPRLDVRLLGGFSLLSNGKPIRLESPRFQAFLASLLLHPDEPQSRARLAFVLWPDAPEPRARNNLRKLLHDLRVAWPAFTDEV